MNDYPHNPFQVVGPQDTAPGGHYPDPTDSHTTDRDTAGRGATDLGPAGPGPESDSSAVLESLPTGEEAEALERPPTVEELLLEAIDLVAAARPLPMSAMAKVNRDDLLDILEETVEALPSELQAARWLLREKEEFLAEARHEHDALINQARSQVTRMVERQEVMRAANERAERIVDDARAEARLTKRQLEDFCDRKLESFEQLLGATLQTVHQGRANLAAPVNLDDVDLRDNSVLDGLSDGLSDAGAPLSRDSQQ